MRSTAHHDQVAGPPSAIVSFATAGIGLFAVGAVVGGTLLGAAPVEAAGSASPKSTTVKVTLSGALIGEGYEIEPAATLTSSPKYEESSMEVKIKRLEDSPSRTPIVTISLRKGKVICETGRSWVWSTAEGSTVTLLCDTYLTPKVTKKIKTGVVVAQN